MPDTKCFSSASLAQTVEVGRQIHDLLRAPACVYLRGDLGTGKTTLCQSIIAAFGVTETVTSPTYNLIHEYSYIEGVIYHMDLYRIEDPSELEYLALNDLWADNSIFLVEWPENGGPYMQAPSHEILIENQGGEGRSIQLTEF
jgi:tRNA threonylcarbamoyladenosine biosynthesis protein TsaE